MKVLLVPLGSHGDVHPLIGIGLALRARGHQVSVVVNPYFGSLVEQAGLSLIPVGTSAQYTQLASNPDLWKPIKGSRIAFGSIGEYVRPIYKAIVDHHIAGETVVVASTLAVGARIAEERHCIPTATVHLQPSVLRSMTDPPTLPGMLAGPRVPHWIMALQWKLIDNLVIDPLAGPAINAFRREVGLSPVSGIFRDYIHSPRRVIGLFPDWFAPPQTDWPAQVRLTGFPLYDERGVTTLPAELRKFLDEGTPPVAFTFGSAMWHAHELLEQSARACTLLGRRGLLLTRNREQLPPRMPPGVKHIDYAPFSELLPHCAAVVHHGGIGTASQALAADVPQIIVPHAHDQHDNAARLQRLGVAKTITPKHYKSDHIAQKIGDLLSNTAVAESCRVVAKRFIGVNAIGQTCELIEQLRR